MSSARVIQHWFIYNRWRGALPWPFWAQDNALGRALYRAQAYFCSTCGEIWARRLYEVDGVLAPDGWEVESKPCPAHGRPSLLNTTLLAWENPLQYFPIEVIRGELVAYQQEIEDHAKNRAVH